MTLGEHRNDTSPDAAHDPSTIAAPTSEGNVTPGDAAVDRYPPVVDRLTAAPDADVPAAVPVRPLASEIALTYQNFLRAIGRHLDRGRYRYTLICQIAEGFVIRGYPSGFENVRAAEALVFTIEDLANMVADLYVSRSPLPANEIPDPSEVPRLLPTGYEDFLRALGHECDTGKVRNIRLVETVEGVVLSYDQENSRVRQERSFDEQQIYAMLNTAFNRRGVARKPVAPPPPPASPLRRVDIG